MADTGKRLLILKTGEKIHSLAATAGDYEDWIAAGLINRFPALETFDASNAEPLPPLDEVSAIAITGSASMVTEHTPWMEQAAAWLREAVRQEIPVLGICFGHQLLAYALGGEVDDNPLGVEVGSTTIHLTDTAATDPLFADMPRRFNAQVSHRQSVLSLPPGARHLAFSAKETHQAFAFGRCAWGLQFHPEFDMAIIRHFIEYYRDQLALEGSSADRLLAETAPSPESANLLCKFALLAEACSKTQ